MDYTNGWNISCSIDLADASRQGQNWKESVVGQGSWSGSFSGQFVAGNTEQKAFFDNVIAASSGTKLTDVKFLLDASTNAISGNIFVNSLSIDNPLGGVGTFTVNFTGDGAPTLASDA